MKTFAIFDLDGTVIDSSHRQLAKPDGSLDLAHWVENSTRDMVMADSLLPLIEQWRDSVTRSQTIVVCTARVLGAADYEFLFHAGMFPHFILSRPEGCSLPDADLKEFLLRSFATERGYSWARFCDTAEAYDDNASVINRLRSLGIVCYDAAMLNDAWQVA